jgi:hypothetical protein
VTARRLRAPDPLRARETDCEDAIVKALALSGYRVHAARPARTARGGWRTAVKGNAGFPDLVIAGHGRTMFVELKRRPNKVEPEQQRWHNVLTDAGADVRVVWVPEGQQAFIDELREHAARSVAAHRLRRAARLELLEREAVAMSEREVERAADDDRDGLALANPEDYRP